VLTTATYLTSTVESPHHPWVDRRRFLLTSLAGVLAAPRAAGAQQPGRLARVGELVADPLLRQTVRRHLHELNYVEGRNIAFETRFVSGVEGRLSDFAAELVRLRVDVLLVDTSPALQAVQRATKTIPIIMTGFGDPVAEGLVASLAHPGGNTTGLSWQTPESAGKRLELLRQMLAKLSRVAVLLDPSDTVAVSELRALQAAAHAMGVVIERFDISDRVEHPFAAIRKAGADALVVVYTLRTALQRTQIVAFAAANRLPLVSESREFSDAGGLMTYGPKVVDLYRQAAIYVDKILKGAKPADLPIEQPTKFDLVINLKTAKALGLTIPPSLLARADQVIE
jgi:putative tryptophan/tyrosine transport system substrate-binding protein